MSKLGLLLSLGLFFIACSTQLSDRSRQDRATHLMNEKKYEEVIRLLEPEYKKNPSDKKVALTLAHAHLGASGFELFDFIQEVMGAQDPAQNLEIAGEPKCSSNEIKKLQGYDIRCVLKRIVLHLPSGEQKNFERAKIILRTSFADSPNLSADINFLGALLELGSALSRLKLLLNRSQLLETSDALRNDPSQIQFGFFIRHLKNFFTELEYGLVRLRYSYKKVSQNVVNLDGKPIIKVGSKQLVFNEQFTLSSILRFCASIVVDQKSNVNKEFNRISEGTLSHIGPGLVRILKALDWIDTVESDVSYQSGFAAIQLRTFFRFEKLISGILNFLADKKDSGDQSFNFFEMVYDHPPKIISDFIDAIRTSWQSESAIPLQTYFKSTSSQWKSLQRLSEDWEFWLKVKLSIKSKDTLLTKLKEAQMIDKRLKPLPAHIKGTELEKWQRDFVEGILEHLEAVLKSEPPVLDASIDTIIEGIRLINETKGWIKNNLWD